ncbi:MAG: hypothetical protein ACI9Y1_001331 [Lentisphaeria bacterium]|jgi:hypothetical protein
MCEKWPPFDELVVLARHAPEQLEELREREVAKIIEQAPSEMRRRLHGLQFKINCQRILHPAPLGSCVAISKMMYKSLESLNSLLAGESFGEGQPARNSNNIVSISKPHSMPATEDA